MTKEINELVVFNKDASKVITSTPLFNESEKKQLLDVSENMEKAHQNSQVFRTDTEVRISVLNDIKFPTPASKYYQALREMNVHQSELVNLLYDYESKKQDIKILEADIMKFQEKLDESNKEHEKIRWKARVEQKKIEINKEAFMLKNMKRTADGRKQEVLQWDKIIKELEPILLEANIPTDNVDSHQKLSYAMRFIRQTINAFSTNAEMSVSESNNLLGQLFTNMKVIREEGLGDSLTSLMNPIERQFVVDQNMLKIEGIVSTQQRMLMQKELENKNKSCSRLPIKKKEKSS